MTVASVRTFQGNGIIKKLQGEVRGLVGKIKVKNSVTVSQEKLLKDTADRLQAAEKELESTQKQLLTQEEQVCWTQTCDSPAQIVSLSWYEKIPSCLLRGWAFSFLMVVASQQ